MTWSTLKRTSFAAVLAAVLISTASAAPPLTTVYDTLYKADGSLFEGILVINWKTFEASDSSNIPTNSLSVQVVSGNLFIKLVPTTTSPEPAYYAVRFIADGAIESTEFWSVPPSDSPLSVSDVRIVWPPSAPLPPGEEGEIEITDVDGLPEALDARPTKGLTYVPSRTAVIGTTGEIEGASGALADCIRVDGTSGPCGSGTEITFVDGEAPSGAINGSNTTFTLAASPNPAASLRLFRNGLLMADGTDFNLTDDTIEFVAAATPATGDSLTASYRLTP